MHTTFLYVSLIFLASLVAGVMNAVAGGGTLVAFPALLLAGVPPIVANATTSLGLWPSAAFSGLVYRKHIETPWRTFAQLLLASVAGGFAGSWLLLHTREQDFHRLIPILLLFAACLFTLGNRVRRMAERIALSPRRLAGVAVAGQVAIAIYGGYFGAAMGVLMLGLFSSTLGTNIHSINGIRSFCGTFVNSTAVVVFVLGHRIDFRVAAIMVVAAIVGGVVGALGFRRLEPALARRIVLIVAWGMIATYIAKMGL